MAIPQCNLIRMPDSNSGGACYCTLLKDPSPNTRYAETIIQKSLKFASKNERCDLCIYVAGVAS